LPRHPLISIVLPVYNPDLSLLEAAVDSVRNQLYPHWELCIADDASTDAAVRPFLEAIAGAHPKIKVTFRKNNGHIAACSNSALELATGEWCGLLDQDDTLSETALAFVAREIIDHPQAGLIYSDEDKIDIHGMRSSPYFKPDWDPELLLGQNYINHLAVFPTATLRQAGRFREGYEGSQDYDLVLRCTERLQPDQIRHIPRVLYHWRMVGGSIAKTSEAKPYAIEGARRAIAEHLQRRNIPGRVEPCPENRNQHRVIYDLPADLPLVSVIIPTRDRLDLLEQCIRSLREETDYPQMELIVIDNDSVKEETRQFLRNFEREPLSRVVRQSGPFNFSRLNNAAVRVARAELVLFLNNDVTADDRDWLREMVRALRPEVGAVGARLWYPNGTLQHGGVIVGLGGIAGVSSYRTLRGHTGYFNRVSLQQNCSAVTGACLLVRKSLFEEVGGFNEVNFGVSFNDVDLCLRLRKRHWRIVWTPYANLIHHESASRGTERTSAELAQFLREAGCLQQEWGGELLSDPFYNPNFSLKWPGYDLAFPPRLPEFANGVYE
jgi:GT2 family glycosyltransferase